MRDLEQSQLLVSRVEVALERADQPAEDGRAQERVLGRELIRQPDRPRIRVAVD